MCVCVYTFFLSFIVSHCKQVPPYYFKIIYNYYYCNLLVDNSRLNIDHLVIIIFQCRLSTCDSRKHYVPVVYIHQSITICQIFTNVNSSREIFDYIFKHLYNVPYELFVQLFVNHNNINLNLFD